MEALPILDEESGKILEQKKLQQHPTLKDMWDTSYSNKLGRLFQGIGKGTVVPKKQRIKGILRSSASTISPLRNERTFATQ